MSLEVFDLNLGAAELMEHLYDSGTYFKYKEIEHKMDSMRDEFKTRMGDENSLVIQDAGVIARFQRSNVYEVDRAGFNDYLYDVGLLPKIASFNKNDFKAKPGLESTLDFFIKKRQYYVKLNPGKKAKVIKPTYDFSDLSDAELARLWFENKDEYDQLDKLVDRYKAKMYDDLNLWAKLKLPNTYGSVSLLEKTPVYDIERILEEVGPHFLIENATVTYKQIENAIMSGIISYEDRNAHRKVVDINVRFLLMKIKTAVKQQDLVLRRKVKISMNRDRQRFTEQVVV